MAAALRLDLVNGVKRICDAVRVEFAHFRLVNVLGEQAVVRRVLDLVLLELAGRALLNVAHVHLVSTLDHAHLGIGIAQSSRDILNVELVVLVAPSIALVVGYLGLQELCECVVDIAVPGLGHWLAEFAGVNVFLVFVGVVVDFAVLLVPRGLGKLALITVDHLTHVVGRRFASVALVMH